MGLEAPFYPVNMFSVYDITPNERNQEKGKRCYGALAMAPKKGIQGGINIDNLVG